jgi:hypothetical protein
MVFKQFSFLITIKLKLSSPDENEGALVESLSVIEMMILNSRGIVIFNQCLESFSFISELLLI